MTKQFSRHLAGALRHAQTIGRLPRRAVLKAGAASLLLPALARRARAETVRPERVVSRRIGGEGALFAAGFDKGMVTSLHASGHEALGDFILQGGCLGQVRGKWRVTGGDGSWRAFDTATMTPARSAATRTGSETRYTLARGLALIVRFVLSGEGLRFDVDIENARGVAIEFGDLAVPLPVNELQRFDVKAHEVLNRVPSERFLALMRFQAERAHALYDEALSLLPAADWRAQKPGLMMASIYRTLLREIEARQFPVLRERVALTPLRKFWLAWKMQALGRF